MVDIPMRRRGGEGPQPSEDAAQPEGSVQEFPRRDAANYRARPTDPAPDSLVGQWKNALEQMASRRS
jgi:hypothetical protein